MEAVPSTLTKTFPKRGPLQLFQFAEATAFKCFRCGHTKKSKLITVYSGDWSRKHCNGCYGWLRSIYKIKVGTGADDLRAEQLADALLSIVPVDQQRQAELLFRASEKRAECTPTQKNDAWELGWKQQYDSVQFTIAAYHMKWDNQVFNTTVLAGNQTSSFGTAGSSKYNGLDFEIFANPTDWLDLQGGFTYTDAKLTTFASRGSFDQVIFGSGFLATDNAGNRPGQVPKWSGSLSATVFGDMMDRGWFLRGDLLYEGSMFMDNSEFNKNKGAARINLRAGIDVVEDTTLEVYVTNVTDNKRLGSGATTNGVGGRKTFGPPYEKQRFGVRLLANF